MIVSLQGTTPSCHLTARFRQNLQSKQAHQGRPGAYSLTFSASSASYDKFDESSRRQRDEKHQMKVETKSTFEGIRLKSVKGSTAPVWRFKKSTDIPLKKDLNSKTFEQPNQTNLKPKPLQPQESKFIFNAWYNPNIGKIYKMRDTRSKCEPFNFHYNMNSSTFSIT